MADTELDRALAMQARYRAHLARILARWQDAQGTALVGEWGLPWAMADDARQALAETLEQPCTACA